MERRVVALAKGDGFQEVLVALDASADTEYPVVESTGGMWDLGGHCHHGGWAASPWPCGGPSVSPHTVPMVSLHCPLDIPLPSPCLAHTVPMGCSCSVPILLLWCPLLFPLVSTCCTLNIAMVPLQYSHSVPVVSPCHSHTVPMVSPCHSHTVPKVSQYSVYAVPIPFRVPMLFPQYSHSVSMVFLWGVPSIFPYCPHTTTLLSPWDVPLVSPVPPPFIPILFPWCPPGTPTLSPLSRVPHSGGHRQQVPAGHLPPEPQAPSGPTRGEGKWGGGTLSHSKSCFFTPKFTSPSSSWPPWGRSGTTAPLSPSCSSSLHGPPCTRSGRVKCVLGPSPGLCHTEGTRRGWICPHVFLLSLSQAYHLFQLLKLQRVFVTRSGELVGAVSRTEVKRGKKEEKGGGRGKKEEKLGKRGRKRGEERGRKRRRESVGRAPVPPPLSPSSCGEQSRTSPTPSDAVLGPQGTPPHRRPPRKEGES